MRKDVVRSALRIGALGGAVVVYSAVVGMVGQLTQLGKLRDAGVLSPDEFAAAKTKLLGG